MFSEEPTVCTENPDWGPRAHLLTLAPHPEMRASFPHFKQHLRTGPSGQYTLCASSYQ